MEKLTALGNARKARFRKIKLTCLRTRAAIIEIAGCIVTTGSKVSRLHEAQRRN
jgi:hypothetical protein